LRKSIAASGVTLESVPDAKTDVKKNIIENESTIFLSA